MTKVDIYSGFLGAGKTTLIKKMLKEAYGNEKVVLIENEFGEIGIDGGFMQDAGVEVTEMNSGCICCSLVGDFGQALEKVIAEYAPDRIIIEPSGVGKLSDVVKAIQNVGDDLLEIQGLVTVVDANKCKMYMKNFGEFFNNQVESAGVIVLSHTDRITEEKLLQCVNLLREHNSDAQIVTTPWEDISAPQLLNVIQKADTLEQELEVLKEEQKCHHHEENCGCGCHHHEEHEHHHEEDCGCGCHHHEEHEHHHEEDCGCGCHHHEEHEHHHEEDCGCGCHHHEEHEHHHEEDCGCGCHHHEEHEHHHEEDCGCGCHHHEEHEHHHGEDCGCGCHHGDHNHHHADEVFESWGVETPKRYSEEDIYNILKALENESEYGMVLRAKGIVPSTEGTWIHFDYIPGSSDIRYGAAGTIGRLCVIGSQLHQNALEDLFLGK